VMSPRTQKPPDKRCENFILQGSVDSMIYCDTKTHSAASAHKQLSILNGYNGNIICNFKIINQINNKLILNHIKK